MVPATSLTMRWRFLYPHSGWRHPPSVGVWHVLMPLTHQRLTSEWQKRGFASLYRVGLVFISDRPYKLYRSRCLVLTFAFRTEQAHRSNRLSSHASPTQQPMNDNIVGHVALTSKYSCNETWCIQIQVAIAYGSASGLWRNVVGFCRYANFFFFLRRGPGPPKKSGAQGPRNIKFIIFIDFLYKKCYLLYKNL